MAHSRSLIGCLACLAALGCSSCGPRMGDQVSIRSYERQMPTMPAGAVPTTGRLQTLTAQQTKLDTNPLSGSPTAVSDGRIYYGYYCRMCHGLRGDGNGPVGHSYTPKPTDLSSATVTSMTDGQLYNHMLHGLGHSPVMVQTVPLGQRWQLVAYVRTFAKHKRR